MLYLGIDTGKYNIGYAVYDSDTKRLIDYGDINPSRLPSDKKEVSYVDLYEKLSIKVIEPYNIESAVLEKIFATPATLPNVYAAIEATGVIKYLLEEDGITYTTISPKAAKKYFTGNGNASKEQIAEAVGAKFGVFEQTTHTNDAIAIVVGWYLDSHVTS